MRLLLTTDVVGGVWDFCCTLATELRAGHQVALLALGRPSANHAEQARAAGAELIHEDLKLEWMAGSAAGVRRSQQLLADLVWQLRPDVVHANQYALASANVGAPVVLTAHSDVLSWHAWALGAPAGPEWESYARLVRNGLRDADIAVAVSSFLAGELAALYRVRREMRVIHNGWSGAFEVSSARPRPRLSLLAGRAWDAGKNIGLAAQALEGWDAGEVVFAGDLTHPESGAAVPLGGGIGRLGRLSQAELRGWLSRARVYVSPARYDPFGLLPLQAALAGCALLLSDIPSYRELWNGAAAFSAPDDAEGLRERWRELLDDERAAAGLAERARARALERYGSGAMAAEYLRLYERVAAREAVRVS